MRVLERELLQDVPQLPSFHLEIRTEVRVGEAAGKTVPPLWTALTYCSGHCTAGGHSTAQLCSC